jgi:hypothetical protein
MLGSGAGVAGRNGKRVASGMAVEDDFGLRMSVGQIGK